MPPAKIQQYIDHVYNQHFADFPLWFEADRVVGRFFKFTISSRFVPVTPLKGGEAVAWRAEALVEGADGQPIAAQRLFDLVDGEAGLLRLDRYLRIIHALNYFRGVGKPLPLVLPVHPRLPTLVQSGHGEAFQRLLTHFELASASVIIALPPSLLDKPSHAQAVMASFRQRGFGVLQLLAGTPPAWLAVAPVRPDFLGVGKLLADDPVWRSPVGLDIPVLLASDDAQRPA